MSGPAITLRTPDGLKVRCASTRRFAVATEVPRLDRSDDKLVITKRSNSLRTVAAELRKLRRNRGFARAYAFDLRTGRIVWLREHPAAAPTPAMLETRHRLMMKEAQ